MEMVHWLVTINRAKFRSLKVVSRRHRPLDHRLPRTDGPLLADSLEGVRSVGAVKWC